MDVSVNVIVIVSLMIKSVCCISTKLHTHVHRLHKHKRIYNTEEHRRKLTLFSRLMLEAINELNQITCCISIFVFCYDAVCVCVCMRRVRAYI